MPSKVEDDWSDSDDDNLTEIETSVLLGVPDGPIDSPTDTLDAAVSRIGGLPALLPSPEPNISSSKCKNCDSPMELLVQMWCPFEDSPMDRALYVWACANGPCQRKEGSVRAWRGLRFNSEYAKQLEEKLARRREKEQARKVTENATSNPFSVPKIVAQNPFGLGSQVFGSASPVTKEAIDDGGDDGSADEDSSSEAEERSLITAMASATLETSPWSSAPSYRPLYLSTVSEYLPPPPKTKIPPGAQVVPSEADGGKDTTWVLEGYENSLEVDHVFERFTKRVGYEGEQCVRYELGGIPLPFASDMVFDILFPAPPKPAITTVSKADFIVTPPPAKRTYQPSSIPRCPHCHNPRVFECQLMPNIINIFKPLTPNGGKKQTDAERRREVERELKRKDGEGKRGMEWGTCLVFSCEKDCAGEGGAVESAGKDCWREELVMVQWDH
ncbi:hypothetical protein JAAARDRAFT_705148 [Jaapia argillacea MUCL 33604]|uniref:Programmed cell death protein 2 C-terminal domain-containing protein n=1 Tax=Jaapia argillacea MUCL 33604 TaxID=933084 RepID=A0A067Q3I3_9AGAM|nr:hypothetical protein JAAARDRAFT_705148 [Jaapia argillacea MUCL 33604]